MLLEKRMFVYKRLIGDTIVAAGIETYLGRFSLKLRQHAIAEWIRHALVCVLVPALLRCCRRSGCNRERGLQFHAVGVWHRLR